MRLIRSMCGVFFAAVIGGCSNYNLQQAQDSYVDAVASEQVLTLESGVTALAQYKITLVMVDEVIQKDRKRLEQDGLLGVAYTLKALTLFKIADLETDQLVAGEIPSSETPQVSEAGTSRQNLLEFLRSVYPENGKPPVVYGTRDSAVMRSLYGLYDYIGGRAETDAAAAIRWFRSAIKQLEEAHSRAPATHDVQAVIALYELTVLAEWDWRADGKQNLLEDGQGNDLVLQNTEKVLCRTESLWRENRMKQDLGFNNREYLKAFWQKIAIAGTKPSESKCDSMRERGEIN